MTERYYRMVDDVQVSERWWLKAPYDRMGDPINPELFRRGEKLQFLTPLTVPIRHYGIALDFTFGAFEMPIAANRVIKILADIAGNAFQAFPVIIEGDESNFGALNFTRVIKCLDETKSDILIWTKEDGREDKIGQYRQVVNLKVLPNYVKDEKIFRIQGWEIALIISEDIKAAFEKESITGVDFVQV